jgi:Rne/Rng family ribonuclease
MAKEICISSTPHETRLAILEDDQLAEIYYERENEYTLAGSIYNGRVTRVLPGMQSAFVDVGLERDAFLYVTDFLELEDPEESDELEKAAASGGAQPPREVRSSNGAERSDSTVQNVQSPRNGDRGGRSGQRPDQKQDSRQDRPVKDRRLTVEAVPENGDATVAAPASSGQGDHEQEDSGDPGAKRWRGRRRRRGGRGPGGSSEGHAEGEASSASGSDSPSESDVAPVIRAGADSGRNDAPPRSERTPRFPASGSSRERSSAPPSGGQPAPFVLPGESLSRYGGTPAGDSPATPARPAAPVRPASTFKPSTMIEAPLRWDGSGLLPGESLSKHRTRPSNPDADAPESSSTSPDPQEHTGSASPFEEEFFVEETATSSPSIETAPRELEPETAAGHLMEEQAEADDEFEEASASAPGTSPAQPAFAEPHDESVNEMYEELVGQEGLGTAVLRQDEAPVGFGADKSPGLETDDLKDSIAGFERPRSDASASHRVDPSKPTGFRLFGLGGKKKTEEAPATPEKKPASVAAVSDYAPGSGPLEEEVIEEEEFDAPHHHGKAEEHDLDDYEEETLPAQLRSGDLGEMLQEAHLDHKIQLNFDAKGGEDDGDEEGDDEDEEEPAAEGQPAVAGVPAQPRRDRGGRGRRSRGGPADSRGPAAQGNRRGQSRRSAQTSDLPIISDLLKPGQEILVQIAKEPIAKKGARITSHIALPGRFLVFMPTVSHVGVSRKIASDEERQRLKRILVHERGEASGGFIVRTAAEGASEEELRADLRFLIHLWDEVKQRSESSKSPALIYHDLSLIERILRDQVSSNFSSIWVDSEADYERIVRFLNRFSPNLVRRVKLYTKEVPLFEHFGIQDEISKALRSKVWLKSGGSIVINQTEALVAIDINTGKYVGKSARLEDTILKTNLDAVPEIVRQIRLRDLGGIIVIDFIDMDERKNRFKVMAALEEALKSDRAPTKVLQFNDFGLVAITRKRVKQSLERTLSVPCPTCQATGMVKSPTTVCNEIYIELRKMKKHFEGADVLLRVNPETVKVLKSNNSSWLTEFEELVGKNILVKSDATLHAEQFDIQG